MKTLNDIKRILKGRHPDISFINEAFNYLCFEVAGKWFEIEKNYKDGSWEIYKQTGTDNKGHDKKIVEAIVIPL